MVKGKRALVRQMLSKPTTKKVLISEITESSVQQVKDASMKPKITRPEQSGVLDRVRAFLPVMAQAHQALATLSEQGLDSVNMEKVSESEFQVIELNLGLGVLEEKQENDSESECEVDVKDPMSLIQELLTNENGNPSFASVKMPWQQE